MSALEQAAQQALGAYERFRERDDLDALDDAMTGMRQALEAEQADEPVAKLRGIDEYGPMLDWFTHWVNVPIGSPLYTRPQPAVPLLDKVVKALADYCNTGEIDGADDLLASVAYAADPQHQPAIPQGWRLVPAEPTDVMAICGYAKLKVGAVSVYRAMLAAAPEAGIQASPPEHKPLTLDQILQQLSEAGVEANNDMAKAVALAVARVTERAHGITGGEA